MELVSLLVGMAAGITLLYSGFPMMLEQLRSPQAGTRGERKSRLLMAIGNAIWVLAGVLSLTPAIVIMCGINSAIQFAIWRRMNRNLVLRRPT